MSKASLPFRPARTLRHLAFGVMMVTGIVPAIAPATAHADVIEIDDEGTAHVRTAAGAVAWIGDPAVSGDAEDLDASLPSGALPSGALAPIATIAPPAAFAASLVRAADLAGISPALLEALVWQESRWRPGAVSPKGALGLGQIMPGTARQLGVDPRDPDANLIGAARYLRSQLDRFDNDIELALAAYNAGPGRVARGGTVPNIAETRAYVAQITARLASTTRLP